MKLKLSTYIRAAIEATQIGNDGLFVAACQSDDVIKNDITARAIRRLRQADKFADRAIALADEQDELIALQAADEPSLAQKIEWAADARTFLR